MSLSIIVVKSSQIYGNLSVNEVSIILPIQSFL